MTNQMIALANAILRLSRKQEGDKVLIVGSFMADLRDRTMISLHEILDFPRFQERVREEYGIHLYHRIKDFEIVRVVYGGRDITEAACRQWVIKSHHVITRDVFLDGSDLPEESKKHLLVVLRSGGVKAGEVENGFLREDMVIEDPEDVLTIRFGCPHVLVDLTDLILSGLRPVSRFHLPSDCVLNSLDGDPMPGVEKELVIDYKLVDHKNETHLHQRILPERHHGDIYLDLDLDAYFAKQFTTCLENDPDSYMYMGAIDSIDQKALEQLFRQLPFHPDRMPASPPFSSVSVVHARIEEDMINHFRLDRDAIVALYQDLIMRHIPPTDAIMVLCADQENDVVAKIKHHRVVIPKPSRYREENAIADAMAAQHCGHSVFIGMWNPIKRRGSSYSHFLSIRLNVQKRVLFDMETMAIFIE